MKSFFVLCSFLSLLRASVGQTDIPAGVLRRIEEKEAIVDRLAEEVVQLFENRTTYLRDCSCSRHSCSNHVSDFRCSFELGNDPGTCGDCRGRFIGFKASAFRTPPNTNIAKMPPRLKESICLYSNLEPLMKELLRDETPTWIYFGGVDGSMRIYPTAARTRGLKGADDMLGGCSRYDPRIRPWFIGASTRPKDIVFVIDVSGSMNDFTERFAVDTRWDVTKRALISMLDTLASFDYVNIVTFSDSARRLATNNSLLQGTRKNLEYLEELVEDIYPSGTTNFDAGFKEAFDILNSACEEGIEGPTCSGCHKVIFFLTDGRDTSAGGDSIKATTMLNKIADYQLKLAQETNTRANIFTFSMGETSDDSIPRQVACANAGSWSFIGSDTDALTAMNSYYHFLTDSSASSTTTWINPYEDAGGLGLITTVSKPVYSRPTDDLEGVFIGVAAHDVLLSEIESPGVPYTDVLRAIIERSQRCGETPQTLCQLQVHRNTYLNRAVCVDPITSTGRSKKKDADQENVCFRGPGKFYKLFNDQVSWSTASRLCKKDRGRLVVIETDEELEFVAGLSSPDGSWIGARRNYLTFEMEWSDKNVPKETLEEGSPYWGFGEPNNYEKREDCVHIDRRGTTGNLNDARCDIKLSFVCEYESGRGCDDFEDVPEQGYFRIPPLSACVNEEEAITTSGPHPLSRRLSTEDVMCDLGKKKDNFEVKCCPKCKRED